MSIYKLYVKTHITGIKYLGYTKSSNPEKYKGSGVRWLHLLRKHGFEHTTEILYESDSKDDIKEQGLHYSKLWNVVENPDWANLTEETGDGGVTFEWTDEMKAAASKRLKGKSLEERFGKEKADELKEKARNQIGYWLGKQGFRKGAKQGPSPFKGKKRPEISIAKKGIPSGKKGLPSPKKGKTYGPQKNPHRLKNKINL